MTMQQLLWQGVQKLNKVGMPDLELDARYLSLEVSHLDLASFLAMKGRGPEKDKETEGGCREFRRFIGTRVDRAPPQHLTGTQKFMGFRFLVNEHVLIPRQDTETLVGLVLEEQKDKEKHILDICTGFGRVATNLVLMDRYQHASALDVSTEVLTVVGRNRDRLLGGYESKFELSESDMLYGLETGRSFDVIISDPPYTPSWVIEDLNSEVRGHELRIILDGSSDGLTFYHILAKEVRNYLVEDGGIYIETGYDQSEAVEGLSRSGRHRNVKTFKDLAGQDRAVRARV